MEQMTLPVGLHLSEVANVFSTQCNTIRLGHWLQMVCPAETPKKFRPALMPHGVFNQRKAAGLVYHSGIIQIDIDQQDNTSVIGWHTIRDVIGQQPHVICSAISASGSGIFALVKVTNPAPFANRTEDEAKKAHRAWAQVAMDYIDDVLREELDLDLVQDRKVSNNLASLRFMHSDPNAWVNMEVDALLTRDLA